MQTGPTSWFVSPFFVLTHTQPGPRAPSEQKGITGHHSEGPAMSPQGTHHAPRAPAHRWSGVRRRLADCPVPCPSREQQIWCRARSLLLKTDCPCSHPGVLTKDFSQEQEEVYRLSLLTGMNPMYTLHSAGVKRNLTEMREQKLNCNNAQIHGYNCPSKNRNQTTIHLI